MITLWFETFFGNILGDAILFMVFIGAVGIAAAIFGFIISRIP